MAVPYTFASATTSIPLSELDANFATTITLGNTAIELGNTVTTLNNMTLANVTISSGSVTITDITASGNVTLSGGTANGVVYLNGSKVVTSGSALTFDGTNLGVGTSSPDRELTVYKASGNGGLDVITNSAGSTAIIQAVAPTDGYSALLLGDSADGDVGMVKYDHTDNSMQFTVNAGIKMYIDSSGSVGIGTSSHYDASTKLTVAGRINTSNGTAIGSMNYGGGTVINMGSISNHPLQFMTNNTTRAYIDTSGNLGLGVAPSAWAGSYKVFQINNAAIWGNPANSTIRFTANTYFNGTNYVYSTTGYASAYVQDSTGIHSWQIAPSGTAGNTFSFTQAMTLNASGNLGIGTSSPSYPLHVQFSSASAYSSSDMSAAGITAYMYNASVTDSTATTLYMGVNGTSTDAAAAISTIYTSAGNAALAFGTRGGGNVIERLRIDSSGNVGIGTSSPSYKLDVSGQVRANVASYNQFIATRSSQSWVMGIDASNNYVLRDETGGDTKLYLSTSGNLGLGVTPSAWTYFKPLQAVRSAFAGSSGQTMTGYNVFYDGSYKYIASDYALKYAQNATTGAHTWDIAASGTAGNAISFTQAMTLDASGNLLIGGTATPTSATASLAIFNGTAPTASVTNGIVLYAEDVTSSSELKVRDEAGNVTTLSPHNFSLIPDGPSEDMAWAYYSEKGGKRINVDMLKLARMVEKLTGEKLVYED